MAGWQGTFDWELQAGQQEGESGSAERELLLPCCRLPARLTSDRCALHTVILLLVQPVQLAVQELRYGLALLAGRATLAADGRTRQLAPVLARLMAFPQAAASSAAASGPAAASLQLDSPAVQQAVADAAAAAAEARAAQAVAAAGAADGIDKGRRSAYAAGMSARLQLLRCSLAAAARDVEAAGLGSGGNEATAAAVAAQQAHLHAIFMGE